MKNKTKRRAIPLIFLILVLLFALFGNPLVSYNNYKLKHAIREIPWETKVLTLEEIVPFEWDSIYTFSPYIAKKDIETILGFRSNAIKETVSEGMLQIIFVKGNKIVSSVCGYTFNLGYRIYLPMNQGSYGKLSYGDSGAFLKSVDSEIVALTYRG